MSDHIVAQNRALNIALNTVNALGVNSLILANVIFSLQKHQTIIILNIYEEKIDMFYLLGFGSNVSGFGFVFFVARFGSG